MEKMFAFEQSLVKPRYLCTGFNGLRTFND